MGEEGKGIFQRKRSGTEKRVEGISGGGDREVGRPRDGPGRAVHDTTMFR